MNRRSTHPQYFPQYQQKRALVPIVVPNKESYGNVLPAKQFIIVVRIASSRIGTTTS
jgi:hypothetical protein